MNLAPTEEMQLIACMTTPLGALGVLVLSVIPLHLIVFEAGFGAGRGGNAGSGPLRLHPAGLRPVPAGQSRHAVGVRRSGRLWAPGAHGQCRDPGLSGGDRGRGRAATGVAVTDKEKQKARKKGVSRLQCACALIGLVITLGAAGVLEIGRAHV